MILSGSNSLSTCASEIAINPQFAGSVAVPSNLGL